MEGTNDKVQVSFDRKRHWKREKQLNEIGLNDLHFLFDQGRKVADYSSVDFQHYDSSKCPKKTKKIQLKLK